MTMWLIDQANYLTMPQELVLLTNLLMTNACTRLQHLSMLPPHNTAIRRGMVHRATAGAILLVTAVGVTTLVIRGRLRKK